MQVDPLSCPACRGPVPLGTADTDTVTCPYCSAKVTVPEAHRQLRRDLLALPMERADAERLYRKLGRPPRFLRLFRMFESAWFWLLGAGLWICFGIAGFIAGTPVVGAAVFHVNTWDVLTERQQSVLSVGGTIGSIALGVLLAGWSHKRVISRRALQAAMLASPPHAPGGPALCRNCGAALTIAPDGLGARCEYCQADNLVQLNRERVASTRQVVITLTNEKNAALVAYDKARRDLRASLLWRFGIGAFFVGIFVVPFAASEDPSVSRDEVKLYAAPETLPKWTAEEVPTWECGPGFGYPMKLLYCDPLPCEAAYLVALHGRRPFQLTVEGGPDGLEAILDGREVGIYSARWTTKSRAPVVDGHATLIPPLSGWYRLRLSGGERPVLLRWCGTQR